MILNKWNLLEFLENINKLALEEKLGKYNAQEFKAIATELGTLYESDTTEVEELREEVENLSKEVKDLEFNIETLEADKERLECELEDAKECY